MLNFSMRINLYFGNDPKNWLTVAESWEAPSSGITRQRDEVHGLVQRPTIPDIAAVTRYTHTNTLCEALPSPSSSSSAKRSVHATDQSGPSISLSYCRQRRRGRRAPHAEPGS